MKTLLPILALTITASAQSIKEGKAITDWTPVSVGESADSHVQGDGRMVMSFANVQRSDETFKGWMRFVLPSSSIALEGNWKEIRFYVECDCRRNTVQALAGIAYGIDGSIRAEKSKTTMEHTAKGSMGRELFEFFCERGGKPVSAPTLKPSGNP